MPPFVVLKNETAALSMKKTDNRDRQDETRNPQKLRAVMSKKLTKGCLSRFFPDINNNIAMLLKGTVVANRK